MEYEDTEPSMTDPEQGWENDTEEDLEDDVNFLEKVLPQIIYDKRDYIRSKLVNANKDDFIMN